MKIFGVLPVADGTLARVARLGLGWKTGELLASTTGDEFWMASWAKDTDIGGARAAFPETRPSAVLGARSDDPLARARAFAILVSAYWKPVYRSIRIRFGKSNEDAKDLTQDFFTHALEREMFASFDPGRARFRVFVRGCLRNFVLNAETQRRRIKRGGGAITLSLDFEQAERELELLADPDASLEDAFDRDLAKQIEALAVAELEGELASKGKANYFKIFQRYDLKPDDERPTYGELAEELDLKVTDVTNHLAYVRRRLRQIVLSKLREITVSDEEFREEAREMLGIEIDPRPS
ncbi:MAG: sigma-70 family RNA polymerase sigma factor [Myxococcota bacterium]